MSYQHSYTVANIEQEGRANARENILSFGVSFLDDAMLGILKNDLILIGARSGAGKTQFCVNVALSNIRKGKRVHFIALEAEQYEIERRIKYQLFSELFYENKKNWSVNRRFETDIELRETIDRKYNQRISFQNWMVGDFLESLSDLEEIATEKLKEFKTLFTYYKTDKFDVKDFVIAVLQIAHETDLIIVDHVHYFDYDDSNENQSIKEIAKTARMLALENSKPIILVSHLRKADKYGDLVPSLEEFHGSSDLYKIATKAITLAAGGWGGDGKLETFIRIVKNRFDGSVTRVMASINYLSLEGRYEQDYKLGDSNQKRDSGFAAFDKHNYPSWARVPS